MTIEALTRAIRRTPFTPFEVHLADGRNYRVSHPEMIAHGGGRTAVLFTGPEQLETIDLPLLVSLTETPQPADAN